MPTISTNHTPRNIPIPHAIQITLRHILRPPDPSRSHLRLKSLHHLPPLIFRQPIPKLRLHSARTDQINPQRLQIQRQLPRQPMQTRRKRADNTPVRDRMLRDRARGDGVAAARPKTQMRGKEFAQEHGGEEADHAGLLDERHVRIGEFHSGEGITCCEHRVVEEVGGVGGGFVEESGEIAFEGRFVIEVAGVAGDARAG